MVKCKMTEDGLEIPDSMPMEVPVGFTRPPTIQEMIRAAIRTEISREAMSHGDESFEEADDFDTGDDPELRSPYELDDEQMRRPFSEFVEEEPVSGNGGPVDKEEPSEPAKNPAKKPPKGPGKGKKAAVVADPDSEGDEE